MSGLDALAVVVPTHDEQDRVLPCLDALELARRRLAAVAPGVRTRVVVVLDDCRDHTAALVATRSGVETVVVEARRVGAARRAGTEHVLATDAAPPPRLWTVHTDADSRVPVDWLLAQVHEAGTGADAVLGSVVPDDDLAATVRTAWGERHPAVDGHPHVHGANLGVRASALVAVGGWRPLPTGEDVDLAARLRARPGLVVRSTARPAVVTSSRPDGRAPRGFSSYLRDLASRTAVRGAPPVSR